MLLYIDPGTGSMLFSMVIGLVTALVFAGRALMVKLRFLFTGGSSSKMQKKKNPYVIYSDSKRYHNIFAPICDAFEERKLPLIYYTQSPDDPLLDREYQYVTCEFIGEGNKGIARMNFLQADVCLSTTPGLDVLQWKRSRDVGCYVHIPHAVSDFSTYRMFGLDHYDAVLINGENQKRFIRKIENYWKRKEKELVMTGSVYMDEAAKHMAGMEEHICDIDHPTILVAASWGENTLLKRYGSRLLKPLVETGFHIIVRPHPQSYVSETDMLEELQKEFPPSDRLEWNRDVDNLAVLNRADLMISDFSGVIFDYSFLFGRPVFYADIDFDKSVYDADWFDEEPWDTRVLPEIGRKLEEKEFADIKNILLRALQDQKLARGIEKVKEDCWANRGKALDATVEYLTGKQKEIAAEAEDEETEADDKVQTAQEPNAKEQTFFQKFWDVLVVFAFPVLLYFVEGPLSVYVANSNDFSFHYQDFFYALLLIGLAVWIIAGLIGAFLPERFRRLFNSLVLYAGLMSYIQDLFLNIKLSEPDGSNMRWEELRGYTAFNMAVWLAVFALFIVFYVVGYKKLQKKYDKIIVRAAGFFAVIQLVVIVSLLISAVRLSNQAKEQGNYGMVGEGQYEVAQEKNVIIFIIDSYGSAQLDYALESNPDLLSGLEDFTYYSNADSCYPGTFPSMTYMLTGVPAVFDRGAYEYLDQAWKDEGAARYYETVHDAGYTFRLYSNGGQPVYGNVGNLVGLVDNAVPVEPVADYRAILFRMAKISIYKYVPYLIKPRFEVPTYMFSSVISYAGEQPINCGNSLFYDGLKEGGLTLGGEENAVIIQHLDGMHLPNETAADGTYQPGSSMLETEEGVWHIVNSYLEQLKNLGVYENASIIITADHGRRDVFEEADDAQIVFFMKPAGQKQEEMTYSSAPISLADMRATILDLIGVDHSSFGTSVYDWKDGELRERTLCYPGNSDDYPQVQGEVFNIYMWYNYTGDRDTLIRHIREDEPEGICQNPGR